jgi:hypothetical protein
MYNNNASGTSDSVGGGDNMSTSSRDPNSIIKDDEPNAATYEWFYRACRN